jgi:cytochrome c553
MYVQLTPTITPPPDVHNCWSVMKGSVSTGTADVPSLAGRFATTLVRQLDAFQRGSRHAPADAPMQAEVAHLSASDMISVVVYAASLTP